MRRPTLPHSRFVFQFALIALLLGSLSATPQSAAGRVSIDSEDKRGNLLEIKDKRRVALLVMRSSVIDASGSDAPVIAEALAAKPKEALRHRFAYGTVARKLNSYMRKYRSMSAVYDISQADIIIYFKLVEYRRLLSGVYAYGEMFVIVNPMPDEHQPARVIWKTHKVVYAEDAIKDVVKELKRVRGER